MALHLNLFHEIEKQKARERRDPLKLSMMGLGAVAGFFALWYFYEFTVEHNLNSKYEDLQATYSKLKIQAEQGKKREEELSGRVKLSEALVARTEGRFYWASVLDSVTQVVPREVQITRLAGDLSTDKTRRCSITIEGLSAGSEPRKVAEGLRRALIDKFSPKYKNVAADFRTLEDGRDSARLDGQQLPTALFSINLRMQTGEDEAPPAPARKTARKPSESTASL